jgi:hypothetical protein
MQAATEHRTDCIREDHACVYTAEEISDQDETIRMVSSRHREEERRRGTGGCDEITEETVLKI